MAALGARVVLGVEAVVVAERVEVVEEEVVEESALGLVLERRDHWGQAKDLDHQDERCFHFCCFSSGEVENLVTLSGIDPDPSVVGVWG